MGYTHYWDKDINGCDAAIGWEDAMRDCTKIVKKSTVPLDVKEVGDAIFFNGVEKDAHEDFSISYKSGSDFCKTAEKPYDTVVVAILARLAELDGFEVSSDGNASEWEKGVAFASKVLHRKINNPIE